MTTVVDPLGSPVPVYNRSGTVIIPIAAEVLSTATPPPALSQITPIPSVSERTVVVLTTVSNGGGNLDAKYTALPGDAQVGDVVEMYVQNGGADARVQPAFNVDTINDLSVNTGIDVPNSCFFRKVSATNWRTFLAP